ncbi:serine hydrolase domain-containing protein [Robiginitalea sp. IMCC44478]|uniref:serine hydrolase domain-containing protein n=1 Tax=Robiginitalea sp. IMCC44478 TaxID=3459122 RepID=UPI0040424907
MKSVFLFFSCCILFIACRQNSPEDLSSEIAAIENSLLPAIKVAGDSAAHYNIYDRMQFYKVPGISIAVVAAGKLKWAKGYGLANTQTGEKVTVATLFQAGSISKPVAALAALHLVDQGILELDTDVNDYLRDWQIPETDYTKTEKVTLRRLLTHTAGVTVHGFPGYMQKDTFPDIIAVLDGKGNTPPIRVDTIPGSMWRYSGGGYTIMEKMVEDISGLVLEAYMGKHILPELGMENSTYQQPLGPDFTDRASAAYDSEGKIIEGLWHNYPEQAAAGLWTTPSDLGRYIIEIQEIAAGKRDGVLSGEMVSEMLNKHMGEWGLGPALLKEGDSLLFGHGGKNAGFSNNMIASAHHGNGIIVMTNADQGTSLMGEITRGISDYYQWEMASPREVVLTATEAGVIQGLTGNYILDFQVPDIGDYIIEVSLQDGNLFVNDPNNGDTNILKHMDSLTFIDIEKGDEVQFERDSAGLSILWNNRFRFNRIEQ